MTSFFDLFRSGFLLQNALWASIAVGVFCPLIGVYFLLRRMVLLGIALPQVSQAGIAFVFLLQGLGIHLSHHAHGSDERLFALLGSFLFTMAAIFVLAALDRAGTGRTESRIGVAFAVAYALAILLVSSNPTGNIEVLSMLHGEIVSVSPADLRLLIAIFSGLAVLLAVFNRQFLLVSFDRETALAMGKHVLVWDVLLYTMIGVAISISVLIVGPMLTFAALIIPPLTARRFCRSMRSFFFLSSAFGAVGGLIGFYLSYQFDWPLAPTDIFVQFLILLISVFARKISTFRLPAPAR